MTKAPDMNERLAARKKLLNAAGWGDAAVTPLTADASTRSYARLNRGAEHCLLMDAPPGAEAPACPPAASDEERKALGYNAMARLAGPRMEAFTGIARLLYDAGIRAPHVYADDPLHGFALIEDFGDLLLARAVDDPQAEARLYRKAIGLLQDLRRIEVPETAGNWPLLTYDHLVLETEAHLLPEWFAPHVDIVLDGDALAAWSAAWEQVLTGLSAPGTLVLRDFHAENILVGPDEALAVIDFQDALVGQPAYDAVSLIEDARRDVDPGLARELFEEDSASTPNPKQYETDFAILAAQRNAKILGIFARLIHRDGKEKYRDFIPRVERLFRQDIGRPAVEPVRLWTEKYMPHLLKESS